MDAEGNTAQPAAITIEIKKNKTGLTYSDMDGDPAHYAAIYLSQKGVMTGETIGSCAFFHPNRPVTRSEFIAMTAAAADLSVEPTDQTDFADDSGLSAWAKPYISAAAANGLVSGYATVSGVSEIRGEKTITTAEAGVVLDHLLDGTLSGVQYAWSMSDHSPQDWAQPAIARLERASVLYRRSCGTEPRTPARPSNGVRNAVPRTDFAGFFDENQQQCYTVQEKPRLLPLFSDFERLTIKSQAEMSGKG